MTDRVLTFVNRGEDAQPPDAGGAVVVLSPWWTAGPTTPAGIVAVRPLAQAVLRAVDVPGTSIDGLDAWAEAAGIAPLFHLDGIAWWNRVRMAIRWDVYELVLWRHVLAGLEAAERFDRARVPEDRPALAAACRALGLAVDGNALETAPQAADGAGERSPAAEEASASGTGDAAGGSSGRPGLALTVTGQAPAATTGETAGTRPLVAPGTATRPSTESGAQTATSGDGAARRPGSAGPWRRVKRAVRGVLVRLHVVAPHPVKPTRREHLDLRVATLAESPSVLVITWAGAFQVTADGDSTHLGDPYLDAAMGRLDALGEPISVLVVGRNHRNEADWATLATSPREVPFSYVVARWRDLELAEPSPTAIVEALEGRGLPRFDVAGCDIAQAVLDLLPAYAGAWLAQRRHWYRIAGRFLDELRPKAMLIDREGTRGHWIAAAQERGVPVVTIQHGMIYPGNPEYFAPDLPGSLRPDVTCVFGPYERDLLVDGAGYPSDEVVVTGSPRVQDWSPAPRRPAVRESVRRQLGVAAGNQLLVVSAAHSAVGELITASMLAAALDGPLPGVHVVVKLHPQDQTQPDYAGLFAGLAAAGGYEPVPVTVVRDIDLLALLAAADAHLGQSSTVLTDAVAAGLPNMVAIGQSHADPIGYAAAGVAVAVCSVDDVRAFMADIRAPSPEARTAFLEAHFLPVDAAGRLAEVIRGASPRTSRR